MHALKKGNSYTQSLAYMSLVRPILEYGALCWVLNREGQINALDRVQKKAAKFANHTNDSGWETLAQRRKIARISAMFKSKHRRTGIEIYRGQVKRTIHAD
jgi:hypothetical protein